jgi:secretion/DNA translocation related TadE-like protein
LTSSLWRSENGAGTVLAVAIIGSLVAALAFAQLAFQVAYTGQKTQAAADAIALATTDSVRGLAGGYPCEVAKDLAVRNKVTLDECRVIEFDSFIRIHVEIFGMPIAAKARAGPSG